MSSTANVKSLLRDVRVYASYAALKPAEGDSRIFEIDRLYDELYQRALGLKLASAVSFLDTGCPQELLELSTVVKMAPKWYPANRVLKRKVRLVQIRSSAFGNSWVRLRLLAEAPKSSNNLWDNDPALTFDVAQGATLCRSACIAHEGHVFFFVYSKERAWENALRDASLTLIGEGEAAYRQLVPEPGKIAGD